MSNLHAKANANRFDAAKDVIVGPPSILLRLCDVAKDEHVQRSIEKVSLPTYKKDLTGSASEALAKRMSVVNDVQKEVKNSMQNTRLAMDLRKQLLSWAEAASPEEAELDLVQRKRKRGGKSMDNSTQDQGWASPELKELSNAIPQCFRFLCDPALASAYFDRDGRLDDNAICRHTPSKLLKHDAGSFPKRSRDTAASSSAVKSALLLSISVWARPTRAMWAKERFAHLEQLAKDESTALFEQQFTSSVSERSDEEDEDSVDFSDEHFIPKRKGKKPKLSRDGPYKSLKLVQQLQVRSDASLQDLRDSFVCRMDDFPERVSEPKPTETDARQMQNTSGPSTIECSYTGHKRQTDSCFLIEDTLYGEQEQGIDSYASVIASRLVQEAHDDGAPTSRAQAEARTMGDVSINDVRLRCGKLYGFLHQGSCEHLWAITSVRMLDHAETSIVGEGLYAHAHEPITTFLQYGFAIRPLVRWTHPKVHKESYTLGACDLCKARTACMVVVGGERFRALRVGIAGMKQQQTSVCEACWSVLNGRRAPDKRDLVHRAGLQHAAAGGLPDGVSESHTQWHKDQVYGPGWTVVPALE